MHEHEDKTLACKYCDGMFCGSSCYDAHLIGFPRCGGDPPIAVIKAAEKRTYEFNEQYRRLEK